MRRIVLTIVGTLLVAPGFAAETSRFDTLFGELLHEYWRPTVTINGIETTVFDYAAMQRDAGPLIDEISETLATIDPVNIEGDNAAKAFWVNVYNFAAIRMVINAYPVDSITSFRISLIKHPWSKKSINVGGQRYSLSGIEKDILLPRFNDPRIIFAVSCAAVSCPDRTAEPFDGAHLEAQLDELIRTYFRNPKKGLFLNRETNTLTLAWIIKKDSYLFQDGTAGVLAFVSPYLNEEQRGWLTSQKVTLEYFDHDWTLNDLAQANGR